MSLFAEMMTEVGAPNLLEVSGETIVVSDPEGGQAAALTALVSEERRVMRDGARGTELVSEREFSWQPEERQPRIGLLVTYVNAVGEFKYAITDIPSAASGLVTSLGKRVAFRETPRGGVSGA